MKTFLVVVVLLLAAFLAGHMFGDRVLSMAGMTASGPDSGEAGTDGPVDLRPPAEADEPADAEPAPPEADEGPYTGDVIATLSRSLGGSMGNGEFKAQGGLIATPANDAEASCDVVGFNLVYVPRRQDPVEVQNPGARYTSQASQLVQRAKPGDIYYFDNVRVRCEGNDVSRQANTLVFKIR